MLISLCFHANLQTMGQKKRDPRGQNFLLDGNKGGTDINEENGGFLS